MSSAPVYSDTPDERVVLNRTIQQYAGRYYLSGSDKDALVQQTITISANEPDLLTAGPIEKAIADTVHRIFIENQSRAQAAMLCSQSAIPPQASA